MSFRTTFNRMISAREKQANRFVNGALLNLDDETLAKAGLTRAEVRARGTAVYPF